jgi:hypothetical protein
MKHLTMIWKILKVMTDKNLTLKINQIKEIKNSVL